MTVKIKTKVKGNYKDLILRFDLELFEYLKPKNAKMEIVKFTGSKTGDKVHLRFLNPFKMEWISHITADGINDYEAFFIDKGVVLPPFLGYWKHKHIVKKLDKNNSEIIDEMSFKASWRFFTFLLFPVILLGFYPRRKAYKKYFGYSEFSN